MASDLLLPGERLDDLIINDLKIIQHENEFCFSLDAILLAHFATVRPGVGAVDLGAGTGVVGLLLLARGAGNVTGIELNEYMADMAGRSARLNGLDERLKIVRADLRKPELLPASGEWGLVVANPPYRQLGGGFVSPNDKVALARHEIAGGLQDFIAAARWLVKYRGRFAMVHLPERLTEVVATMSAAGLEPKRLQLVYPSPGKKPKFLLVEGIRGAKPGLDVLPPLMVYDRRGNYSPEIMAYYKNSSSGEDI